MNFEGGNRTVCPFYQREKKYSVTCEGIDMIKEIHLRFENTKNKSEHQQDFCFDMKTYKTCIIYNLIMDHKYRDFMDCSGT